MGNKKLGPPKPPSGPGPIEQPSSSPVGPLLVGGIFLGVIVLSILLYFLISFIMKKFKKKKSG